MALSFSLSKTMEPLDAATIAARDVNAGSPDTQSLAAGTGETTRLAAIVWSMPAPLPIGFLALGCTTVRSLPHHLLC